MKNNKNEKLKMASSVTLAIVALVWGTTFAVLKDTLSIVQPFSLMMFRFGFSALLLFVIYIGKIKKAKMKDIKNGSIIGIFMFLAFYFMIISIKNTTASKVSFIIGAYVLIVPFLAWIINKKRPDKFAVIGAFLATVGLGFLTIEKGVAFNIWDMVAGCCSFFFAAHMIAIEKYGRDSDPILITVIQFIVTAGIFIILVGYFEGYDFSILPKIKWTLGYLVVISTVISFAIQTIAQRYISSTSTALILTLQSVFGAIFAVWYLNERMTFQMGIGCMLVFVAIVTQETKWEFLTKKN
ncbi:DMT family transporter [Fusobacterium ulcerans]|uniref:DMT family transporter n=1 Tax=Fusobacterium ulcerans TaxID=861 RepID=UPI002672E0C4|nr:DMT family transporter [Fusobacterium ulcerans]